MTNQYNLSFPSDKIKLNKIYQSNNHEILTGVSYTNTKIEEVYGEFLFPELPSDRAYTLGSFVQSIDGKIAFPQSPDGTLVAKGNVKDPNGALADFWILNLLRTVSDAVLMGSKAISREPLLTGHIFDSDLVESRIKKGKPAVPLHIIVTGSGKKCPVNHKIFKDPDIPALIVTTENGKKVLKETLNQKFVDLNISTGICLTDRIKAIISIGKNKNIDLLELLSYLKKYGVDKIMVESPSFLVSLMQEGLLDELYLNTSSIFIGGDALSIGQNMTDKK